MKLIEPKAELLEQRPGVEGMYEIIDKVAGVCYNREGVHDDSKRFVETLVRRGHMRPLEFGTVYLYVESNPDNAFKSIDYPICGFTAHYNWSDVVGNFYARYDSNPFSEAKSVYDGAKHSVYITTNYRVIVENGWEDDLQFFSDKTENHANRPCVVLTCSRVTGDSFRTHITLSSVMRSTRYCDYSNMEIVRPVWLEKRMPGVTTDDLYRLLEGCDDPDNIQMDIYWWWYTLQQCQDGYKNMVALGRKRQEARGVLPFDAGTRLCLCGFIYDEYVDTAWNRFLKLRLDGDAHDDAQLLANQIKELITK